MNIFNINIKLAELHDKINKIILEKEEYRELYLNSLEERINHSQMISKSIIKALYPQIEATNTYKHLCQLPEMGTYEGQVVLVAPDWLRDRWPKGIGIDACLALEIQKLWGLGIKTNGHCCGHGKFSGYIGVYPEHSETMLDLGYQPYLENGILKEDHFFPKNKFQVFK